MNRVILHGFLSGVPEVRHTAAKGIAVAKFPLGVPDKLEPYNKAKTLWINVVAWGKLAEFCGENLTKSQDIIIEGRLQKSSWEKDGQRREQIEVVAESLYFCGPHKKKRTQEEDGIQW